MGANRADETIAPDDENSTDPPLSPSPGGLHGTY